jgi:hypothetical protein
MLDCSKVALFGKVDREMTAWEELRLVAGRADYSVTAGRWSAAEAEARRWRESDDGEPSIRDST